MTEQEREEIDADLTAYAAEFCADPDEDEMEARYRDHLADLQKTRDALLDDDKALAFWKRYRGETV